MESKWLIFKKIDKTKHKRIANRKTDVWWVYSKSYDYLGLIEWYAPWRQYCYDNIPSDTVLAPSCLLDIAEFCKQETKAYRERKK